MPISCFHNPEVGEERRLARLDEAVVVPKAVLVVGGGPAGMKAAEIAARRGHRVTLAEAGPRLGGRLNLVESLGGAANLLASTAWIEQELALLKVTILTQTLVDGAFVAAFSPDAIIMATGAVAADDLGIPTDGSVLVLSSDDAVCGQYQGQPFDMTGNRVLAVDLRAAYESALVVEGLVRRGARVTVATPHLHVGANLGFTHLADYTGRLLPQWGVEVRPLTALVRIANGQAILRSAGQETGQAFDFIVALAPPHPRDEFQAAFRRAAPTRAAGDVVAPRSAMEAFREGDRAGRTL